jgi:hypothetical protein
MTLIKQGITITIMKEPNMKLASKLAPFESSEKATPKIPIMESCLNILKPERFGPISNL